MSSPLARRAVGAPPVRVRRTRRRPPTPGSRPVGVPLGALLVVLLLVGAVGCTSATVDRVSVTADPAVVRAAADRTLGAATGHFELETRIGAAGVPGATMTHTRVAGSFDRSRAAVDAALDLAALVAAQPNLVDGLPEGAVGDVLQVRVIGPDAWVRNGSSAPWRATAAGGRDVPAEAGLSGPDELLGLVALADGQVTVLGGDRYVGHISADALAGAEAAPSALASLLSTSAPRGGAGARLLRYELALDDDGLIREALVRVDLAAVAEELGEPLPEGVRMEWSVRLRDLGEAVEIEPPT